MVVDQAAPVQLPGPDLADGSSPDFKPNKSSEHITEVVARRGLAGLSSDEVSLLLESKPEGAPFVAPFRKRQACYV